MVQLETRVTVTGTLCSYSTTGTTGGNARAVHVYYSGTVGVIYEQARLCCACVYDLVPLSPVERCHQRALFISQHNAELTEGRIAGRWTDGWMDSWANGQRHVLEVCGMD